jgi:hypothetical protein
MSGRFRIAASLALLVALPGLAPFTPAAAPPAEAPIDPLGPNSACYVCHITFVRESLSKAHLAAKVPCIKCHGLSDKHANDEHIGATKPDHIFKRAQVDRACSACHDKHDVPAATVVARYCERKLPANRTPVCTDCHGTHRIDRAAQ